MTFTSAEREGEKSVTTDAVVRPNYYGGADNPFEVIKVFRAWFGEENYRMWLRMTVVKYLVRVGKKEGAPALHDLEKAHFYLGEMIASLKREESKE